tara:strand:- start:217 stop:507 length:291 start_codon:yes stop_codon:yes gene_type:complete
MGFKLTLILGILLLATIAGSAYYIDYLQDQISTLKGNQIVLETEIERQNESIKNYLDQQKNQQVQLNKLEADKQKAMQDVNRFVKHLLTTILMNWL